MKIPQKTPRLAMKLVNEGIAAEFQAATFYEFKSRYRKALQIMSEKLNIGSDWLRKNYLTKLHVNERPYGADWAMMQSVAFSWSEKINNAYEGKTEALKYFPEYDLQLATIKAGSPAFRFFW